MIFAALEGMRIQMEDHLCSMFDEEQMKEISDNLDKEDEMFYTKTSWLA